MSLLDMQIATLAKWLTDSSRTVVLTGAGMSTESGVPDFRSQFGWWRQIDPTTVATVEALRDNYPLFHQFYAHRVRMLEGLGPHEGHRILADWERRGLVHAIATQNVDGFHQVAGSKQVYELHGSIRSFRCAACGQSATRELFLAGESCTECGGRLRPNVVLFDEWLPEDAWRKAVDAMTEARLVLVIGTSLNVYPANQLPSLTKGHTVVINLESTPMEEQFDLVIHGKAGDVLKRLETHLNPAVRPE
jgi:NAD-dependent deacetylase